MNNPNHPNFYTDNIHLLNNMNMLLGAASTGQAEQHKPGIIQYQYATNVNAAVHPMNLATTTSSAGKKLFLSNRKVHYWIFVILRDVCKVKQVSTMVPLLNTLTCPLSGQGVINGHGCVFQEY